LKIRKVPPQNTLVEDVKEIEKILLKMGSGAAVY